MTTHAPVQADDEVTDLQWFCNELKRLEADGRFTRARVTAMILSLRGERLLGLRKSLARDAAMDFARAQLKAGATRAQVRNRLMAGGYCGSQNSAYRVIQAVLNAPPRGRVPRAVLARHCTHVARPPAA